MPNINQILSFFTDVVKLSFSHLSWLLGVIFIFGIVLYFIARFSRDGYVSTFGEKIDKYFTGLIGVPVHELGHAFFCLVFRHKIDRIVLFSPSQEDGTLGYVNHSYNPRSGYQKIGNFFIGIGPILFGSIVLYVLMYFLLPSAFENIFSGKEIATNLSSHWGMFWASATNILNGIFRLENLSNWKFWVFIYLSLCIASHTELSPADIKGAFRGLLTLILLVLFINFIIIGIETLGFHSYAGDFWQYIKIETYSLQINKFLSILTGVLSYTVVISSLNFLLSFLFFLSYCVIKLRRWYLPFVVYFRSFMGVFRG